MNKFKEYQNFLSKIKNEKWTNGLAEYLLKNAKAIEENSPTLPNDDV